MTDERSQDIEDQRADRQKHQQRLKKTSAAEPNAAATVSQGRQVQNYNQTPLSSLDESRLDSDTVMEDAPNFGDYGPAADSEQNAPVQGHTITKLVGHSTNTPHGNETPAEEAPTASGQSPSPPNTRHETCIKALEHRFKSTSLDDFDEKMEETIKAFNLNPR